MELSVPQDTISAIAAATAVTAAVAAAREAGCLINAAVVDIGGNLTAFLRMPGAFLHSIGIAQDKAYTAAGFGMPTEQLFSLVGDNLALREGLTGRPRLVMFGGGLPIKVKGRVIGGIGVSGGSEDQDRHCAVAGLAALGLPL